MLGQEALTPADWLQTGVIGGLVLGIIWAGLKRKWLFYWTHEAIVAQLEAELKRERAAHEEWKTVALTQAGVISETVERTEKIVHQVVGGDVA